MNRQPVTGIVATLAVIAVSLGFISLFTFSTFTNWVSFYLICTIPMQIIVGVNWNCKHPSFAVKQSQPMKGLLLTLITVMAGTMVSVVYMSVAGGNISPPAPMLAQCTIVSVVVTFWASIMWGGWPFHAWFKDPVTAGIAQLIACYAINYALFRVFFNYDFLKGAPVYVASLDPHGLFNGWSALVFYVTALAIMFLMLHFDLWPLTKSKTVMKQPLLGLVWTAVALILATGLFEFGVQILKMDVVTFLVTVPIPFIFGTIIVLNMLESSLFRGRTQPQKGILSAAAAGMAGTGLAWMYQSLSVVVSGNLHSGPPGYDYEIWLASALLSVTFPFLIIVAAFFNFWPLRREL